MANLIRRENRDVTQDTQRDWDPFRLMDAFWRWDPFRSDGRWLAGVADFRPRFDLKETKDSYVVQADLPGVPEKELDISVTGNILNVSGQREEQRLEEGDRFHAAERGQGRFVRTFTFPDGADLDGIQADHKDGVLTVRVPKRPELQPRRIDIGKGATGPQAA
jgi:HSP20 family protein